MDLVYLLVVGGGLVLAWQSGILDQAGQAIVNATQKGQQQGYARERIIGGRRRREIIYPEVIEPYPIVEPVVRPRMRLTIV